jgi:Do/DeqQ family serine protease
MTATQNTRARLLKGGLGAAAAAATLALVVGTAYQRAPNVEAATDTPAVAQRVSPGTDSYADLVSRVGPAVVTIKSVRTVRQTQLPYDNDLFGRFFGDNGNRRPAPHRQGGLGSGVIVREDGYILTNNHVVENADKIEVDLPDGHSYEARVVGTDQPSDLAVLKVAATKLPTVPLGDSDHTRVGAVVLAIGNPLGLGQTVTMGIVSAKGRATGLSDGSFEDFIQTDAPINQCNSGGALVNTRGELVGINSQILSPVGYNIGIGFAIPVNMAQNVMHQLMEGGKVRRGMLGVTVQALNGEMAQSLGLSEVRGAIVSDVKEGSPAARAGLKTGDVILALDGKPVDSSNSLRNHIAPLGPGAKVTLTVMRDGHEQTVNATLDELPTATNADNRSTTGGEGGQLGITVEPLTPELARRLGVSATRGVVIGEVDPDGPAAEAGLQSGDVIEQANGNAVSSAADLKAALSARGNRPVLMLVNRQGTKLFITVDNPGA